MIINGMPFLLNWGPMLILLGIWIFFMRQMQTGGNTALSFGKSKAKLLTAAHKKVTFADVAGIDEAKEEVIEIVDFLKDPQNSRSSAEGCQRVLDNGLLGQARHSLPRQLQARLMSHSLYKRL